MKIFVYGIAKNESKNVKRYMDSIKEADGVYICDTGSTDKTISMLRKRDAIVNEIEINPWRFDLARNMSLSYVPKCDICLCLDLDEVMLPGWRQGIEKVWGNGITEIRYPYVFNWEDEAQTIPRLELYNFKIHARYGYTWHYPVHETCEANNPEKVITVYNDNIICHHHPDLYKKRNYQKLLDIAVKEYPNCQRMSHLRGRELMMFNHPREAIKELRRHLTLTKAYGNDGIGQTRAMSMRYIARCLKTINGSKDEILDWMLRSCGESPYQRESWIWLAQAWFDAGDYLQAYACCQTGLRITDKKLSIECEGCCWGDYPKRLSNKALILLEVS